MKKQKLINFKRNEDFQRDLQAGELLETSIIFVDDTKKIYTHNTEFDCSGGGSSDWNNIENRPFGEKLGDLLYSREDVAFDGGTDGDYYLSTPDTNTVCPLEVGKTYRLLLDDKEYDLTCSQGGLDDAYLFLTDKFLTDTDDIWSDSSIPNGGLVFFRCGSEDGLNGVIGKVGDDQPEAISKVEIYGLEVKTIEPKFLPISQEMGESKDEIMSQRAVTDELRKNPFETNHMHGSSLIGSNNNNTGSYSSAEGYYNTVTGDYSHVEGNYCKVLKNSSHAEGNNTKAAANFTHAEGYFSEALGNCSHAEGDSTIANGKYSHTEGLETVANNDSEHASGQYNISSEDTLFSVGNGKNDIARHNAFEIKRNGDVYIPNTSASGNPEEKPMLRLQDFLFRKWEGTQEEYDAIVSKDPDVFYFIKKKQL